MILLELHFLFRHNAAALRATVAAEGLKEETPESLLMKIENPIPNELG